MPSRRQRHGQMVMKTGKRGGPAYPWAVERSDAVRLAEAIAGTQQSTNIFLTIKNSSCKFLMRIMITLRLLRILMTIAYNHRLEFCKVDNNAHTRERAAHWRTELQTVEKSHSWPHDVVTRDISSRDNQKLKVPCIQSTCQTMQKPIE